MILKLTSTAAVSPSGSGISSVFLSWFAMESRLHYDDFAARHESGTEGYVTGRLAGELQTAKEEAVVGHLDASVRVLYRDFGKSVAVPLVEHPLVVLACRYSLDRHVDGTHS